MDGLLFYRIKFIRWICALYFTAIAEKQNNLLEEQRAHATLGRTYFCAALCQSNNTELLNLAQKHFLKGVVLCSK